MKKDKKVILLILGIIFFISIAIYWIIHDSTFVRNNLVRYTGATEFIVESEYHDSGQSFIKVILTNKDRSALLNKHKFELSLDSLKGRVTCPYIQYTNKDYMYFVEPNDRQYGYLLYCLSKKDNTLILYEYFGD